MVTLILCRLKQSIGHILNKNNGLHKTYLGGEPHAVYMMEGEPHAVYMIGCVGGEPHAAYMTGESLMPYTP